TKEPRVRLIVRARDDTAITALYINGTGGPLDPARSDLKTARIEVPLALDLGENPVRIEARDRAGRTSTAEVVIVRLEARVVPGFEFIAKNTQGYDEYRHELTGIVFVLLPGGTYRM